MSRLSFAMLAAAAALILAALAGSAVVSAQADVPVTIHEGADAPSWGFTDTTVTVQVGQTVTWTNDGDQPHDAAATDGSWKVPLLNKGASASYTFTTPGTYAYICTPHPWMQGTIVVTAAPAATAEPAPPAAPADPAPAPGSDSTAPPDDGSGG